MAKKTADRAERRELTLGSLVQTSIAIIERDGVKALSMRKIASELGVGVMSLYRHVPNKEALLESVAESVLAGLDAPGEEADAGRDWKLDTRAMAEAFRATARRYPRSMHLVLTSRAGHAFRRRTAERAMVLFAAAGFGGATSVHALRTLMAYVFGTQMLESGAFDMADGLPGDLANSDIDVDLAEIPHVVEFADDLLRVDPDTDFEYGLEMLLSALDRLPRTAS